MSGVQPPASGDGKTKSEEDEKVTPKESEKLGFTPRLYNNFEPTGSERRHGDPEVELETIFSDIAKEIEEGMNRLTNSKDRAQMTANTALSLSLIVVLKELIDVGPGGNKYYYVNLTLVSISLFCQVVIGFLALVMYSLRSKDEGSKRRSHKVSDISVELANRSSTYEVDGHVKDSKSLQWYRDIYRKILQEERESIISGCINYYDYTDAERAMIRFHDFINEELTPVFLEPVVGEYTTSYGTITSSEGSSDKPKRLRMVEAQVALKVRMIKRKKLLDNITAVQNAITYMMYIVFILNAFITGFGLS